MENPGCSDEQRLGARSVSDFRGNLIIGDLVIHVQGDLRLFVEALIAFGAVPGPPTFPDHEVEAFGV
jgi:hypothetical protein